MERTCGLTADLAAQTIHGQTGAQIDLATSQMVFNAGHHGT